MGIRYRAEPEMVAQLGPIHTHSPNATGALKSGESITSSIPPNPGTRSDASFCWQSRLIKDSIKSPTIAAPPPVNPNRLAPSQERTFGACDIFAPIATTAKTPKIEEKSPTTAPSIVLFGLRDGHNLWRPKERPPKYA